MKKPWEKIYIVSHKQSTTLKSCRFFCVIKYGFFSLWDFFISINFRFNSWNHKIKIKPKGVEDGIDLQRSYNWDIT